MARRKAESVHVPASKAEAERMLAEYVALERRALEARLSAQFHIDDIKSDLTHTLTELDAERKGLFAGLKAWWEAGGAKELAGARRSAEVNGAQIGIRKPPPSLKFPRGMKAGDVVAWLSALPFEWKDRFLRTPPTQLDKQAVIKALREDLPGEDSLRAHGLWLDQTDEFFIDAGLDEEAVKTALAGDA